jgi:hypothetical protein
MNDMEDLADFLGSNGGFRHLNVNLPTDSDVTKALVAEVPRLRCRRRLRGSPRGPPLVVALKPVALLFKITSKWNERGGK